MANILYERLIARWANSPNKAFAKKNIKKLGHSKTYLPLFEFRLAYLGSASLRRLFIVYCVLYAFTSHLQWLQLDSTN